MGMLDNFVYEAFTGDDEHPDYWRNHPDRKNHPETDESYIDSVPELSSETGIPEADVRAIEPFDPRWSKVWKKSAEMRQWNENMSTEESDQRAFKKVFG